MYYTQEQIDRANQGNPGEGKTTFALRLAAACTTGGTLPGMKPIQPFQVIYQTAEDGLGDTVKPRLMEAEADLDRVLVIDEAIRIRQGPAVLRQYHDPGHRPFPPGYGDLPPAHNAPGGHEE